MVSHKLKITKNKNTFTASYRWFKLYALFLAFFTITWDSFIFAFYYLGLFSNLNIVEKLVIMIFPIFHVLLGIVLTYFTLTLLFNKTELKIENNRLTVRSKPIFTLKRRVSIDINDIDYFFFQKLLGKGVALYVMTKKGKKKKIFTGSVMNDRNVAENLKLELEDYLNIERCLMKG
ncbi:hypothetical protein [Flammeovirga aprica]|uniref:DUF304 domain-containing protein n=1 Tax=Flammeovirga aprica JL-4 TaxID=694437 RepID=A0A7X9X9Z8_9BACT|nr:hypothetical protein [Flammeovirga aprica]NME69164.1 hypothetical protein [Flammeovirga aprica JL-4]